MYRSIYCQSISGLHLIRRIRAICGSQAGSVASTEVLVRENSVKVVFKLYPHRDVAAVLYGGIESDLTGRFDSLFRQPRYN